MSSPTHPQPFFRLLGEGDVDTQNINYGVTAKFRSPNINYGVPSSEATGKGFSDLLFSLGSSHPSV